MLSLLGNPYALIGIAVFYIGSVVGGAAWWGHQKTLAYEAQIAKQEQRAAVVLTEATAEAAKKDNEYAELARSKDEKYNHDVAEINQNNDAAVTALTERVRVLTRRGQGGSNAMPSTTANPGNSTGSPTGSDDGLSREIARDIGQVGEGANKLAAVVRDVCVPWAKSVGR